MESDVPLHGSGRFTTCETGDDSGESARDQLDAVIAHLAARRDTLLQHWREAADADPEPDPMHFFPPEHTA